MNIDFVEAKKELENIFKHTETHRKIVFWYDEGKNFFDAVKENKFNNVETIIFNNNPFKIKHYIEVENTTSNILLYIPSAKPVDTENWLLDILLYSEEYYADTVALTMRRLNLTNSDLRRVVEKHATFFNNQSRVSSLKNIINLSDNTTEKDFLLGMMAVLAKSKFNTVEHILTELVFDDEEKTKYKELVKYGFENELWNHIAEYTNYTGEQSIDALIKRFLMTAVFRSSKIDELPTYHNHFLITGEASGATDAEIFITRIKNDQRYRSLQSKYEIDLRIKDLVKNKGIDDFSNSDVFEIFDKHIVETIVSSLNGGSINYDFFEDVINSRINSKWYKNYSLEYNILLNVIRFNILTNKPIKKHDSAEDYINYYEEELFEVDTLYRHIITDYKKIVNSSVELDELIDKIDNTYENKFLSSLGNEFSKSINKKDKWEFLNAPMSKDFYNEIQKVNFKKMFVIISDALRYEIGKELINEIKTDPVLGGNSQITPMISAIPSETRFGMASLLPNKNISYKDGVLYVDGLPTNGTKNRDKVLKNKNNSFEAIIYEDLYNMSRDELRKYMADKTLVYVYHNTIDKTGENNENKVFDVVPEAIDELLRLIRKLYNSLQISNFIVTADHGFIYKRKRAEESQKYEGILALKSKETSKRFLLTEEVVDIPYTKEFDSYDIKTVVPNSYDFFKTQGGGSQYIHGGASLQEIMIPLIKITELRSKTLRSEPTEVGVRLKSTQRKITRRDGVVLEFEQYEKVEGKKNAREVLVILVDEEGNHVSPEARFLASSTSDDIEDRLTRIRFTLNNIIFDRNNRYFLEIRDANSNDLIDKQQFIIDITNYKAII